MKVLGFAGSNSINSINKQLVNYTLGQLENVETTIIDLNDFEMPLYSIDRQVAGGFPKQAIAFKEALDGADAFVISLAEHNGNFAVALKNILDWVSRIDMGFFSDKKILLLSTSPGGYGGGNVMQVGLKYFAQAKGSIVAHYSLPSFQTNFVDNTVVNEEVKANLHQAIAAFQNSILG